MKSHSRSCIFNIDPFGMVCLMEDDGMSVGVQREKFQHLQGAALSSFSPLRVAYPPFNMIGLRFLDTVNEQFI